MLTNGKVAICFPRNPGNATASRMTVDVFDSEGLFVCQASVRFDLVGEVLAGATVPCEVLQPDEDETASQSSTQLLASEEYVPKFRCNACRGMFENPDKTEHGDTCQFCDSSDFTPIAASKEGEGQ